MLDIQLSELAKNNVRDAMKKEIDMNQNVIDSHVLRRNSPRQNKIDVFTAMARNEILRHFLNLSVEKQQPKSLMVNLPMSDEYKNLMYRIGSSKYAYIVKQKAKDQLILDYTHVDYKRNRYFLDETLPIQPPSSVFWGKVTHSIGYVLLMCFKLWWVFLIAWFGLTVWLDEPTSISPSGSGSSGSHQGTSSGNNTFGAGGIPKGNPDKKAVSDKIQVIDESMQAGYGNKGSSGKDSGIISTATNTQNPLSIGSGTLSIQSVSEEAEPDKVPIQVPQIATSDITPTSPTLAAESADPLFFSLGSSQQEVNDVMGKPKSILGFTWQYGFSTIQFDSTGKVNGWSNIDKNLKVSIGNKKTDAAPFTIGSPKQDVISAMGTPNSILGTSWGYGYSNVQFDTTGKVNGWSNIDKNLKVSIGDKRLDAPAFTINSAKQDVINAMGTPNSVIGNSWSYGYSSVQFSLTGKVNGWSNIDHNLKVFSGSKVEGAQPFTRGSSKEDVIISMGTPTSIIGNSWGYGYSSVQFSSTGKVISWSNAGGNLNANE